MSDESQNRNDGDPIKDLADFCERIAYGFIAFGSTSVILHWCFDVRYTHAAEPAILNAGIAYYTHAASGRIVRALWLIARRRKPIGAVRQQEDAK